jgi:hypothetical protein
MARDAVHRALARLEKQGRLTPQEVVDAARNPKSPLHSYFTWNVREAAAMQWLEQARELIRSVKMEVVTTEFRVRFPKYVHDPASDPNQGYVSIAKLRTERDLARELVQREFTNAGAALARAKHLATALGLADQISELEAAVIALRDAA